MTKAKSDGISVTRAGVAACSTDKPAGGDVVGLQIPQRATCPPVQNSEGDDMKSSSFDYRKPWLRLYRFLLHRPKWFIFRDKTKATWVELLLLADDNTGTIPPLEHVKVMTRRRTAPLLRSIEELLNAGWITFEHGSYHIPHWNERQFESDLSTPRVKKSRTSGDMKRSKKRSRNVPETAPETETETET